MNTHFTIASALLCIATSLSPTQAAADPSQILAADASAGIERITASAFDETRIIRGNVNAKSAAAISDSRKSAPVRKREGMDSKEENDLEFFGRAQPSDKPPQLGKLQAILKSAPDNPIETELPSPAPHQAVTTVNGGATGLPPDTHGAVGRTQIVTAINGGMWITPRSGNTAETQFINWISFWQSVLPANQSHFIFDPRLLYDAAQGRFIVTLAYDQFGSNGRYEEGSLLIGASTTDDASGEWRLFRIPLNDSNNYWVDFPNTGQNQNQVVISINSAKNSSAPPEFPHRTQIVMVDKAGLFERRGDLNLAVFNIDAFLYGGVFYPATQSNSSSSLPLITFSQAVSGDTFTFHRIHRLPHPQQRNGTAVLELGISSYTSALASFSALPIGNALLGNATIPLCANAPSLVERNGEVWFTSLATFDNGGHSVWGLKWAQVVPESGSVIQNGFVSRASQDNAFLCSSIAVNSLGDALIGVSEASPSMHLSASYFFRKSNDAPGSLRQVRQYAAGQSTLNPTSSNGYLRLGDYSHTMLDPLNDKDFWTVQERASNNSDYAISWAQVKRSGPDLETRFSSACTQGNACPVTLRNTGDADATATTSAWFNLVPTGNTPATQYAITLSPPADWRCRVVVGSSLACYKNSAFVVGESAEFGYTYQGDGSATLQVTAATKVGEVNTENNAAAHTLFATQ